MTADTVGGVWTYAMDLCKVLQRQGVNVHLATMGAPMSNSQKLDAAKLPNVEVYESRFALEWMDQPWKDVDKAGEWLLEIESAVHPDLIHLNNYVHGSLPWKSPVLITGHSCVLSWWQDVKQYDAPPHWNIYRNRVRNGLRQADKIVSVSRYMAYQLDHFYGPFANSKVIYNTRDASLFNSADKKPIIFSMGRLWDEAKNISSLQQISGDLSWLVNIAGDTGNGKAESSEGVTFLGKLSQEEIARWLGKSSIYVMPAKYEPFGLSVLEAALSGCALVLGEIPTFREIWGNAAVYVDPSNPKDLKKKLKELIDSPSMLKKKAGEARKKARLYSIERFEESYIYLYRQMMLSHQKKAENVKQTFNKKVSS